MPSPRRAKTNATPAVELDETTITDGTYVVTIPPDPHSKIDVLSVLENANLLIGDDAQIYRDAVEAHLNPEPLAEVLCILQQVGLLSGEAAQANSKAVLKLEAIHTVADTLLILQEAELLTTDAAQANFNVTIKQKYPHLVTHILTCLQWAKLLSGHNTQATFDAVMKHEEIISLDHSINILQKAELFTIDLARDNFHAIVSHSNLNARTHSLFILEQAGILTQDSAQRNFKAIIDHSNPGALASILSMLREFNLVTQANFETVTAHSAPDSINRALFLLEQTTLLSGEKAQKNFETLTDNEDLEKLTDTIFILEQTGILANDEAQSNFDIISNHNYITNLKFSLRLLQQNQLLTNATIAQNYFDVIATYPLSEIMANSIGLLEEAELLSDENAQTYVDAVVNHQRPYGAASAIVSLHQTGLLMDEHLNIVINLLNPSPFAEAINLLHMARLLEDDNFNRLISHTSILFSDDAANLWFTIPVNVLTHTNFHRIIALCETYHDNPEAGQIAFSNFVDQEIRLQEQEEQTINVEQSTHTASVHASVSASAQALMSRYQEAISTTDSLDKIICDIRDWLEQVEETPKAAAAKRCIPELIRNSNFDFEDPVSNVTIKQLVALSWLAIHDDSLRSGTLNDGKSSLLDGLYQIQREYNLSAVGVDDGHPDDLQACPPGAFNKLIEKLVGIHQDVVVRFITHGTASMKFTAVVKEAVISYLTELPQPTGQDEIAERIDLFDRLSDENMGINEDLWETIVDSVASQMQAEFGSLYDDDQNHPKFIELMKQWTYVTMTIHDLRHLRAAIQTPAVTTSSNANVFFQPVVQENNDSEDTIVAFNSPSFF